MAQITMPGIAGSGASGSKAGRYPHSGHIIVPEFLERLRESSIALIPQEVLESVVGTDVPGFPGTGRA